MNDEFTTDSPAFEKPSITPLTDAEAAQIRGGKWRVGTCAAIGYACNTSEGGFKGGLCLGFGYTN